MKVVLVMFKEGQRRDFPLTGERTVIGRRSECTLRIPTSDVSRQHCALTIAGKELLVKDLGSTNGTFVNQKRVADYKLRAGDKLTVGPVTFTVQIDGMPATIKPDAGQAKTAVAAAGGDEVLDLDQIDLDDDPLAGIDAMLDEDDDDKPKPPPRSGKR